MAIRTIELSPITRIEGHLEFKVEVEGGAVQEAYASGALFRGFELMLKGRHPMDALAFTPRICGVCPTSHSIAATKALDDAFQAEVPPNAHLMRSVLLGVENTMSHATAFYALFGPDLVNPKYADHPAYGELSQRLAPLSGSSYLGAVKARVKLDEIYALLGGQHPHGNCFVPGGITFKPDLAHITKALVILMEAQEFVEETILGGKVERWLEVKSLADVDKWMGEGRHAQGDLGVFIQLGPQLGLDQLGRGPGKFVAYGVYDQTDGQPWLKRGFFDGQFHELDQARITEHVKHSWYQDYDGGKHPGQGETHPHLERSNPQKYSFAKSPRYQDQVAEVGPLARMINDRDPLVLDLAQKLGPNVYTRVLARLHEAVRTLAQVGEWLHQIDVSKPFYHKPRHPKEAMGIGMTEAARGALGHWVQIKKGVIDAYQVITPTAWNVSPRDFMDQPGAIEQAVTGTPVPDESNPIEVQHVIRSFDPCIACTVHLVRGSKDLKALEI